MSTFPSVQPTFKERVRIASVGSNLGLSGLTALDGITPAAGDRILAKDQATTSQNGIYTAGSGAWVRASDASQGQLLTPGHEVYVSEGTVNGKTIWASTQTAYPVTIGTTAILYTRIYPDYEALWRNPWDPSTLGDNIERETAVSAIAQASGTLYCYGGYVLKAGITYSALNFYFTSAGSGLTHSWAGLVIPTGNPQWGSTRQLIAVSADNTAAPTANTFRTFTFTAAVTPNYDTPIYFALLLAASTTVPSIAASVAPSGTNPPSSALFGAAPILAGTSTTALTTPQAVNTAETALTAITQVAYAYLT